MSVNPGGPGAGAGGGGVGTGAGTGLGTGTTGTTGAMGHTGGDGPGVADSIARHVKTPETKEFFKTSEFIVWGLTVAFILIAAGVVSGDNDNFVAQDAWKYVAWVSVAYIISRGLSKAGTRRGHDDSHRF